MGDGYSGRAAVLSRMREGRELWLQVPASVPVPGEGTTRPGKGGLSRRVLC